MEEFGYELGGAVRDSLDDRSIHLIAYRGGEEPVASLRLVDASQRPFEIESFMDVSSYLTPLRHFAEITRFCILRKYRSLSGDNIVHLAIFSTVLEVCNSAGVTDLIASTRKDLSYFYRYLLFESFPNAVYLHPEIGREPHTLMKLDLTQLAERYRASRPSLYEIVKDVHGQNSSP